MTEEVYTIPGSEDNPKVLAEGSAITYGVTFEGTPSAVSSVTVYKDGVDYTTTAMPAGNNTVSGKTVTWKELVVGDNDGGSVYMVATKATVDGNTEVRLTYFIIVPDEGLP